MKNIIKLAQYEKSSELFRILGLKQTQNILISLDGRPLQYKELRKTIDLTEPTLSRRLKDLQTFNIIKKEPIKSKRRDTHQYCLTVFGEEIIKFIKRYEKALILPSSQQKIVRDNKITLLDDI